MEECQFCGSTKLRKNAFFDKYHELTGWSVECVKCGELLDED